MLVLLYAHIKLDEDTPVQTKNQAGNLVNKPIINTMVVRLVCLRNSAKCCKFWVVWAVWEKLGF